MGYINIYKIDEHKHHVFLKSMAEKLEQKSTIDIRKEINNKDLLFGMTLYLSQPSEEKNVNWNWLLLEFGQPAIMNLPNSKAVLLIEKEDDIYAVSFGFSYFIIDKYCDRNFPFKYARKIDYKEIRTTALTSPNSHRNKTISSYVNYNSLEFDSGESFTKIKAKVAVSEDFKIYNEGIEIGNSIKFSLPTDSLDRIADLILHIEDIIENNEDKYKIPVFSKLQDDILVQTLNERLWEYVKDNPYSINISEIDIVGATEVFNHDETTFKISYKSSGVKEIVELSNGELNAFAKENNFALNDHLLDIKVITYKNGNPVRTDTIKNLIDYTDDAERCILSKGIWYQYNDDYLNYLAESISEIDVLYNPSYNFNKASHRLFLEQKYFEEKDESKYTGKSKKDIRDAIKKKYYAERYYNIMLSENHGFENYDRNECRIGSADIELMDLYKDNTMYAVKIGNSSGKLCYVVDQSIQALKAYKHNLVSEKPRIENVGVWIILDRVNHLNIIEGRPNINELDMLLLKNKLDSWKKEVRVLGYKPIIHINYVVDEV